ncbi:hypothetical protein [Glycomyces sp. NRRL B-16210]|uniref:hypothetical protein n=1 Tax=Glycomyces sp. NRRL B-16210 TaxID=1463821 RepID=UPI0004BEF983|nr:hypothetical protein [Glycomyces sp. NRRL B-16210]
MSESNLAGRQSDRSPAKTRSRPVKPGHLEVGEFTSGHIGASSPFGSATFPLPVGDLYFEHSGPVGPRNLDDERH